jgi:hypothetical protein
LALDALVVVVHRDREDLLRRSWPMTYSSRIVLISDGFGMGAAPGAVVLLDLLGDDVVAEPMHSSQM